MGRNRCVLLRGSRKPFFLFYPKSLHEKCVILLSFSKKKAAILIVS